MAQAPRTNLDRRDLMTHGKDSREEPPGPLAPRPEQEGGPSLPPVPRVGRGRRKPEAAFDQWLARGLHKMFDDVAREPVPDELLKLIEDDRQNQSG